MPDLARPHRIARRAASLLAIAWLAAPAAMARDLPAWRIDPTHSRVVFDVEHAGFSHSLAVLSKPEGRLRFDPDGWDGAEVDVAMPLANLDFGDEDWNRTMLGRRWFDAEAHPEILFRSTRVEAIDAQHATVHGELTVRGTTPPVRLDVRRNAVKRHPLTLRRTAGFSATAELDRHGRTRPPRLRARRLAQPHRLHGARAHRSGGRPHPPGERRCRSATRLNAGARSASPCTG